MTIYALVDCNNFYVSCERVFNPKLEDLPVIILSSNDGCAIARSNEAKEFGVKMAQPLYQFTDIVKKHDIQVLSGNFHLYTDMSNRVIQVLADMAPVAQQYSVDECFLDLTGMAVDLDEFGQAVKAKVKKWTGIPVDIGSHVERPQVACYGNSAAIHFQQVPQVLGCRTGIVGELCESLVLGSLTGQRGMNGKPVDRNTGRGIGNVGVANRRAWQLVNLSQADLQLVGSRCQPRTDVMDITKCGVTADAQVVGRADPDRAW